MANSWIRKLDSTDWLGTGELWLDPDGNDADLCECSLAVKSEVLLYSWSYRGETKRGSFEFFEGGAIWSDSWHQPESAKCLNVRNDKGLFAVEHSYSDPSEPSWNWRSQLSERPDGSLVLQMTNIAPWGEEGRAVRMIFRKQGGKS